MRRNVAAGAPKRMALVCAGLLLGACGNVTTREERLAARGIVCRAGRRRADEFRGGYGLADG